MRTLRRYRFVLSVGLLIAAGFGLVRAATSDPSLRFATDRIAERLEEQLGLTLTVGDVGAEPGSARIEAGPILLKDKDGVTLFSAERVSLELAPLQMFARRVQLDSLEIDSPRLHIRVTKDGRVAGIKPLELRPSSGGEPLFRVDVKDFRVHDGKVRVDVEEIADTELSGISMRLRSRGPDGHRLKFRVSKAEVTRPDDVIVVDEFGGRLVVFGDGLLAPERVSVSDITMATETATLSIAGSIVLGELGVVPAFDLDVNAVASLVPVLQHVKLPVAIEGAVSVGAHVSTELGLKNPQAVGQADVTDLKVEGFGIGTLSGRFFVDPEHVEIPAASFIVGDTTVHGDAALTFDDDLNFTFRAEGEDFSIYKLMADLKLPNAWADALVNAEAWGSGHLLPSFELDGEARGHFHDVRVGSEDVRTVKDEDLILRVPQPIFAHMNLSASPERMRFEGTIDDELTRATGFVDLSFDLEEGFVLEVESDRASMESIQGRIAALDFTGTGGGSMRIAGPYNRPEIRADAWLTDFSLEEFAFGDLDGSVRYLDGVLSFLDVRARKGQSRYAGDVVLDFDRANLVRVAGAEGARGTEEKTVRGLAIDVDIEVEAGRGEELRSIIPASYTDGVLGFVRELDMEGPIAGPVTATGYIGDGTTDHLTGGGELFVGDGATLLGQTLRGGTGRFTLDLDRFSVENLNLAVAGGTAQLGAVVDRHEGGIVGQVNARGLELAQLDALKGTSRDFRGTVSLHGALSNLANDPTLQGRATLKDAAWGDIPIGSAKVAVDHVGRKATLTGSFLSGRGDGVIAVETRPPFAYTASMQLLEGPARPLLPPDLLPSDMRIALAGAVDVNGTLRAFSESRGTLVLQPAQVDYRDVSLRATGDVLAHFRGSAITIDQLELASPRGDALSLRGMLSSDAVDLAVSSRGDLWFVPSFIPRVTSSRGRFELDLAVTGDLDRASMHGQGRVSGGRFEVDLFDHPVRDVDARLLFRGPNVLLESLRGRIGDAPLEGQGTLTLAGLSPSFYDLTFDVADLRLSIPRWLPSRSSGRVAIKGPAALPTLSGELDIHQATYSEDINWERALPDFRRKAAEVQVFDKEEEDLRFDLHLVADNGIVVENNVLDLEAKGDLYLVGTEERPGLKGTLSLLRGNANFRNNRYRLVLGTVDFVDTYRITPVIDVLAETTVKEYDVAARVSGPLNKDMRIQLSSRPELAEIDVLALLTFGFTQQELQDANNAGAGAGAGLEMVSAYTGLNDEVQRILPESVRDMGIVAVDELRLTSVFSERQGASVPAVSLSFEMNPGWFWGLADDSRLKLQSTLVDTGGAGPEQRVEWEKRFDNDLRFRFVWKKEESGTGGQASQNGDFGADAWYRWEF